MRKGNWDFAKAVLMFLVIYGHVCPALSGESYTERWCNLTRITGLFVMPLFFFISGYFQSTIMSPKNLIQKYRKTSHRVGIPLMVWGGVYYITKIYKVWCRTDAENSLRHVALFVKNAVTDIMSFYWFFSALIICIFLGTILSLFIHRKSPMGIIALITTLPLFTIMKIDFFHFSFVWFYYGCGMLYKVFESKFKDISHNRLREGIIFCATLLCVAIGSCFYPKYTFYYTSNLFWITSFRFILIRYLLCLLASVCALYWIFRLYNRYKEKTIVAYLTQSGQDTLFLYCSHVIILTCIVRKFVENNYGVNGIIGDMPFARYYLVSPIMAVLLYYLLYSLAKYLKKYKLLRSFMGVV